MHLEGPPPPLYARVQPSQSPALEHFSAHCPQSFAPTSSSRWDVGVPLFLWLYTHWILGSWLMFAPLRPVTSGHGPGSVGLRAVHRGSPGLSLLSSVVALQPLMTSQSFPHSERGFTPTFR